MSNLKHIFNLYILTSCLTCPSYRLFCTHSFFLFTFFLNFFYLYFSSSSLFAFICFLPNFILSLIHSFFPCFYISFIALFLSCGSLILSSFHSSPVRLLAFFPLYVATCIVPSNIISFIHFFAVRNRFISFPCSLFINLFLHPPEHIALSVIRLLLRYPNSNMRL